ncbi:MAG: agmatine deiminase family protein [Flavobacteriales bacterium]|nr:agmatine deiminase family protein [Flavobacteriales bacterium]
MRKLALLLALGSALFTRAQELGVDIPEGTLPHWTTAEEQRYLENFGLNQGQIFRGIEEPPPGENLRNMAEWEEIQALTIAWTSYPYILKQIVEHASQETQVIILTEDINETTQFLENPNTGNGAITDFTNITMILANFDSIWMRDYGANPVYGNEVDDLVLVDWIYNRPNRPNDNTSPQYIAEELGIDLYCITSAPADLVNTGGNWMTDGFGHAFASKLILNENEVGNEYNVTAKTQEEIEGIVEDYLGVHTYTLMETLPYDQIHHIDMHMKLIDEETMLVGQFPTGVSDGPQIQANIEYVLANTTTKWGTPWKIVWLPMPSATNGTYPNGTWGGAAYRTYTNSVFVNNTVIVPTYREEFDTTALRIYAETLPGYNIIPIDCDDQPDPIINASGAIHCITHSVGVEDPLLISHNPLEDTDDDVNDYLVEAYLNHRDGIASATMFWKTDINGDYNEVSMVNTEGNNWEAYIPAQDFGTKVYYYIHGAATTGKEQTRPMPAPEGYWMFRVLSEIVNVDQVEGASMGTIYPNPASGITVVPVDFAFAQQGRIVIYDTMGREVMIVKQGGFSKGESKFFFDAAHLSPGMYVVTFENNGIRSSQKLSVK